MEERFWPKVDKRNPDECWEWQGALPDGYGQLRIGGRGTSKVLAHRFAYELLIGPIPEGLQLDHLCRNRACVNPAHLEPVTNAENQYRGFSVPGINSRKTHCIRGHAFDEANTYVHPGGRRECKTCRRDARRAARRAA